MKCNVLFVVAMSLLLGLISSEISAEPLAPLATVKTQIFNRSAKDVRFKIIPFAEQQRPYEIDLRSKYKSPLIPNLKIGRRAFVAFDLSTGDALATAILPIQQDVAIQIVDGPAPGEIEIVLPVAQEGSR